MIYLFVTFKIFYKDLDSFDDLRELVLTSSGDCCSLFL